MQTPTQHKKFSLSFARRCVRLSNRSKNASMAIELQKIVDHNKLNKHELGSILFPGNKYPALALNRILKGQAYLDSNQITRLSSYLNIPVEELFSSGFKSEFTQDHLVLTHLDYRAVLNTKTWFVKIFDNKTLFHESMLVDREVKLSDFLAKLRRIINTHKNKK